MADLNDPSVGIDAATGGTITGWDHVIQSINDIFTTRFGERVMREYYGSFVPGLLGSNINKTETLRVFSAMTSALRQWEPRFFVTQVQATSITADGKVVIYIEGEYRPRALLGDNTPSGKRTINAYANRNGIALQQRING